MTVVKRNILANLIGRGWAACMMLAFVPLYIKFLGIEAYGLIGFFASVQVLFSLMDIGLSTTLNRELAHLSAQSGKEQEIRDLVRTLEFVYWPIAAVIACVAVVALPLMATHWLHIQTLDLHTVKLSLLIMGLAVSFQFPFTLYAGGLLGLQRQELLSIITALIATLRGVGAVLVIWLVSPNILFFFLWQVFASLAQTAIAAFFLWRKLPKAFRPPQFQRILLWNVRRFAAGVTGITVLAGVLTQLDKIILSKLLSLDMFGFYSLAALAASGLTLIASCIFTAIFPRFSQLVSLGDEATLKSLYHRSAQLLSVLILPGAVVAVIFAPEILTIWTGSSLIAAKTHILLSLLTIGTALNGLVNIPYALLLSFGRTRLVFFQNLISVFLLVPLLFWATRRYGAVGAAVVWIILNAGYLLIMVQFMHRSLIRDEKWRWYLLDIGLPLMTALFVALIGRGVYARPETLPIMVMRLTLVSLATLLITALATLFSSNYLKSTI